jgi:hypothetical protein
MSPRVAMEVVRAHMQGIANGEKSSTDEAAQRSGASFDHFSERQSVV